MKIFDMLAGGGMLREGEGAGAGAGAAGTGGAGATETVTAGTGGGAGAGAGAGGIGGAQPSPFDGIANADVKAWVTSKGFKDVGNLAESAWNLEKLTGDLNSIVRLPKTDDPAAWRPVYERLGAGKTADEYQLPVPEGDKGEFAKTAAGWAHELGIPVKQMRGLAEKWNAHLGEMTKTQQTEIAQRDQAEINQLKVEWGQNWQANETIVNRAAEAFGMSQDQLVALRTAMGPAAAMKFMLNIGSKIGTDHGFINGDGSKNFALGGSPDQAKAEIEALRKDPEFTRKFLAGDAEARAKMERLHKIAYPA